MGFVSPRAARPPVPAPVAHAGVGTRGDRRAGAAGTRVPGGRADIWPRLRQRARRLDEGVERPVGAYQRGRDACPMTSRATDDFGECRYDVAATGGTLRRVSRTAATQRLRHRHARRVARGALRRWPTRGSPAATPAPASVAANQPARATAPATRRHAARTVVARPRAAQGRARRARRRPQSGLRIGPHRRRGERDAARRRRWRARQRPRSPACARSCAPDRKRRSRSNCPRTPTCAATASRSGRRTAASWRTRIVAPVPLLRLRPDLVTAMNTRVISRFRMVAAAGPDRVPRRGAAGRTGRLPVSQHDRADQRHRDGDRRHGPIRVPLAQGGLPGARRRAAPADLALQQRARAR